MKAADLISQHEGNRLSVYPDSLGNPTIGKGFNLARGDAREILDSVGADYAAVMSGSPLTQAQVDQIFALTLRVATAQAIALVPSWEALSETRQAVLTDMCFEMGALGLSKFHGMLAAIEAQDWNRAAAEMLNSEWARQVPHRAKDDAELMICALGQ